MVLEKTLESPLDCKKIQPVHLEGNQSWIFIERTDVEVEIPIHRPPDVKNWLIWKDPNVGKNWSQEKKGTTEDEIVGWDHWLKGYEFEQALGDGVAGLGHRRSFWGASVQFSRSVMSDSLQPHELQRGRPCPSPTPGVHPNPCPLSQWCHPAISSSVITFSSCPQSFPALGSFQMSQLFASGGQSIGVSASTSVLSMNIQDWFPLGWTGWISLQSKGLSSHF